MYLLDTSPQPVVNSAGYAGYTAFERTKFVENSATITKVGVYSSLAFSGKAKVGQRNGAGDYTVLYDQSISHGGTGWEDFTLSSPYTTPASGDIVLGAYFATNMRYYATNTSNNPRGYKAGDQTGSATGYSEDAIFAPCFRFELSAIADSTTCRAAEVGSLTHGYTGYTSVDNDLIFRGLIVNSIGLYSVYGGSKTVKLLKRNSTTNYDVVASKNFTHGATGWESVALDSPYTVPDSGEYVLGVYCNTDTSGLYSRFRSSCSGEASGSSVTFTDDGFNSLPLMMMIASPVAGGSVFARRSIAPRIGSRQLGV